MSIAQLDDHQESKLGKAIHALKAFWVRYYPLLISLTLISVAMSGVAGNYSAQLLLLLILAQPLSAWIAKHLGN